MCGYSEIVYTGKKLKFNMKYQLKKCVGSMRSGKRDSTNSKLKEISYVYFLQIYHTLIYLRNICITNEQGYVPFIDFHWWSRCSISRFLCSVCRSLCVLWFFDHCIVCPTISAFRCRFDIFIYFFLTLLWMQLYDWPDLIDDVLIVFY